MGMTGETAYSTDGFRGTVHLRLSAPRMPGMGIHLYKPCTNSYHQREGATLPFCTRCGAVKGNPPRGANINGWKLLAGSVRVHNGQIIATLEVHFKRTAEMLHIGQNWIALKPKRGGVLAFVDCISGEEIKIATQPTTQDSIDDP